MTFLHANKRFGRHDFEAIAKEVGKPVPEVQRYAEVGHFPLPTPPSAQGPYRSRMFQNFWSRGRDEIDGFLKLVAAVEKGEASLREARSFQDSLTAKVPPPA